MGPSGPFVDEAREKGPTDDEFTPFSVEGGGRTGGDHLFQGHGFRLQRRYVRVNGDEHVAISHQPRPIPLPAIATFASAAAIIPPMLPPVE